MEKECISLRPERVEFTQRYIKLMDSKSGKYTIPYVKIIYAGLSVPDKGSGICYEPEITDITADMRGSLILHDHRRCKWKIQTDLTGKTAGCLLIELSLHAPYILIGRQTWFDVENEITFSEIENMVKLMRQC